jgi:hypothetical protein
MGIRKKVYITFYLREVDYITLTYETVCITLYFFEIDQITPRVILKNYSKL